MSELTQVVEFAAEILHKPKAMFELSALFVELDELKAALRGLKLDDETLVRYSDGVCSFCGKWQDTEKRYDKNLSEFIEHAPDCPVLAARAILEKIN